MKESSERRKRTERFNALIVEPGTLDELCDAVASGLTLAEWCRKHDVRYLQVYDWLHDTDAPQRLERYTKALESRNSFYSDAVLSGLRDVAMADVRKLYDGSGKLLDPHKLPDELARVVVGVEEDEDARTGDVKRKVKLESRKGGHELLGRALGLYRDRVEHEGKLTLEELVNGSHQTTPHTPAPGRDARDIPPGPRSSRKH